VAIIQQVVNCPACGASRKLRDLGLDTEGSPSEYDYEYNPVVKLNEFGGRAHSVWYTLPMPRHVLVGIKARLEQALARVNEILSATEGDG
jgi:hypothetical protein